MDKKYSKEDILKEVYDILENDFDLNRSMLNPDADLFVDLDMDSIDAVDMAVRLQQFTDKRISPEEFKKIRTLQNVVDVVYDLI